MSTARTPKTLNTEQQEQLLKALHPAVCPEKTFYRGIRNYLMGCLMLDAGLRVGEVTALRISHLYFNGNPVQTLLLTPSITKNHKERSVPVSARLRAALFQYSKRFLVSFDLADESFCFFSTGNLKPLSTRQVERIILTAATKAFGHRVNPHMLRHTFASKLMRVTNMRTVQELLGHSFITSTQIYTHPNEDDKKKAIDEVCDLDILLNKNG